MCSLDARSGRPIQASLLERIRASLNGRLVIPVIQEMQCSLSVMLGIEGNINAGSRQCQAKEFALAWLSWIKRIEEYVTIYIGGGQQGMCRDRR
jgi:hypothetical protein